MAGFLLDFEADLAMPYGLSAKTAVPSPVLYSTWNAADKSASCIIAAGGQVAIQNATTNAASGVRGSKGAKAGKLYFEIFATVSNAYVTALTGLATAAYALPGSGGGGSGCVAIRNDGNVFNGSTANTGVSGLWCYVNNTGAEYVGIAVDFGAGTVTFYVNGASQGSFSLTAAMQNVLLYPYHCFPASDGELAFLNTGQSPFFMTPPSGFSAWG